MRRRGPVAAILLWCALPRTLALAPARREVLQWSAAGAAALGAAPARGAQQPPTAPPPVGASLLRRRIGERRVDAIDIGVDRRDIYYPSYMRGTWDAKSTTVSVDAPCGEALFGGPAALAKARADVGVAVKYAATWIENVDGGTVADRPRNVRSLVDATLGAGAVTFAQTEGGFDPNNLQFRIEPPGTTQAFAASLRITQRLYAAGDKTTDAPASYDTLECVRQALSSERSVLRPPSVKDVETICLYERKAPDYVVAYQRTATFLFPSDQLSAALADAANGRAVDVRTYRVEYVRRPDAAAAS